MRQNPIHYSQEILNNTNCAHSFVVRISDNMNSNFLRRLLLENICNSLVIYKKNQDKIRVYGFIGTNQSPCIISFFINHRDYFENIIDNQCNRLSEIFYDEKYYEDFNMPLFSKSIASRIFANSSNCFTNLSNKELECCKLLARGLSNEEITNNLNISLKTLDNHVCNIKRKLSIKTKEELKMTIKNHKEEL